MKNNFDLIFAGIVLIIIAAYSIHKEPEQVCADQKLMGTTFKKCLTIGGKE